MTQDGHADSVGPAIHSCLPPAPPGPLGFLIEVDYNDPGLSRKTLQ